MKADMHKNSLDTFNSILSTLPKARGDVFAAIRGSQPVTRQRLSAYMDWPINRVTGRVRELLDLNVIEEKGSVLGPNQKPRSLLVIKNIPEVEND